MRNGFLVPALAEQIERTKPTRILDLGGATGYVARAVQSQLSYMPSWTLVDLNPARLELAHTLKPTGMRLETITGDFLNLAAETAYGCVLLTFTLLEVQDWSALVRKLHELVDEHGSLIVAVPDLWRDVIEHDRIHPGAAEVFLRNRIEIPKIDKFTGLRYPFAAHRTETLIADLLDGGFTLRLLRQGGAEGEAFILVFSKSGG